jgi:pimeloyl-ACP methyl ester carboxylesterase/tellurite resistance protein
MRTENMTEQGMSAWKWIDDAIAYGTDAAQRSAIYMDILRKRGNTYIEHLRSGQPPVLVFNYEMILNGRNFSQPVNYALVRIVDRRQKKIRIPEDSERRNKSLKHPILPKRPIVIIDPRAGHGPGIGGSSRDSEIGMALDAGFTVYFILFYTDPFPGQTLADVERAEVRFIEEINKLHPYSDNPVIMGNCQAGWASALLCADRPDITGPLVLNGAPLSYWAGIEGANPMRYKGGLLGGVWLNMFLSDMGNGKFDGAHLVSNFESLNPANTLWTKQYNLYAQLDTEEERYLKFEKWWGGFYMMSEQEIHFIVNNLFVGNKLEKGKLELHPGETIDMRNIESPILVFASRGDNITPPQQALNWIPRVYGSVEELKKAGQVIIYIIHENIGHLGIFVSASVARKEHNKIIGHFDMIDYLPPGLYEMVIDGDVKTGDFVAQFEERAMEDITAMSDGTEHEKNFEVVKAVSNWNERMYGTFLQPWVKMWTTELSGEMIRWTHPLRFQRYMISDMNPFLKPFKPFAALARTHRKPVSTDNPFLAMERIFSDSVKDVLNHYRDTRDRHQEQMFQLLYDNDFIHSVIMPVDGANGRSGKAAEEEQSIASVKPLPAPEEGGFAEGLLRGIVAMIRSTPTVSRRHYTLALDIAQTHRVLQKIRPVDFKRMVRTQARILETNQERAIKAMSILISKDADRMETIGLVRRIALADGIYSDQEKGMLEKISHALKIKKISRAAPPIAIANVN